MRCTQLSLFNNEGDWRIAAGQCKGIYKVVRGGSLK